MGFGVPRGFEPPKVEIKGVVKKELTLEYKGERKAPTKTLTCEKPTYTLTIE